MTTFALLDNGSTLTFCEEKLLRRLGIEGDSTTVNLSTMTTQNGKRFRQHPVAFMGDVEATFHQVKVNPGQRDVLRFLWWPEGDTSSRPEVYRMTVHLFGGTWSPSCCAFALRHAATESQGDFHPDTVKAVERSFYVGDCLHSVPTSEDTILQVRELSQMLSRRGFSLRKWVSNTPKVMAAIPLEDRSKAAKERDLEAPLEERALGVFWNVDQDSFTYRTQKMESLKPLTKLGHLSMLSSVYDPLWFACHPGHPAR